MRKIFELTYQQLLVYGIHLGHTFANSSMYAAWLVYTYKDNMLIINIFKTFYVMKVGFRYLHAAVNLHSPIWFVNLDRSAGQFTRLAAIECGESSWTIKWIHGAIANYPVIHDVYKFARKYQSEWSIKVKHKWYSHFYFDWRMTRHSWPRLLW